MCIASTSVCYSRLYCKLEHKMANIRADTLALVVVAVVLAES